MAQTEKSSFKVFESDISGLDYNASDLVKDTSALRVSENLKSFNTDGLSKREGFEAVGGNGLLFGIATYNYQDRTSGASKEELIGFGHHVFRLTNASATITRTSGSFYITQNRSAGTITLTNNGATNDLVFSYTPTDYNIGSLTKYHMGKFLQAVLATGLYTVTLTHPGEIITAGTWTLGGINQAFTVTGTFGGLNRGISYTVYDDEKGFLSYLPITNRDSATTARTNIKHFPFKLRTDNPMGSLTGWIESLYSVGTQNLVGAQTISWQFWDGIPCPSLFDEDNVMASTSTLGTRVGVFSDFAHDFWRLSSADKSPRIQAINLNNKLYISCPYLNDATTGASPVIVDQDVSGLGKLYCYDGKTVYRAGVPSPQLGGILPSTGISITPSVSSGKWKYMCTFVYLDANGVEWESNPSAIARNDTGGTGAGTSVISAYPSTAGLTLGHMYFDFRATKVALGATSTTFQIKGRSAVPSIPEIRVGDRLWASYPTGTTTPFIVQSVSYNGANPTITLDRSTTLVLNDVLTTGMFVRIYRTKEFGSTFYQLLTRPVMANDATYATFTDTAADSTLTVEYIEPLSGQEHDLPPIVGNLCSHQGTIVSGGSIYEPNTAYWSGIDGIEYFPRAFNSTDIPSTTYGAITAVASVNDNSLAVFKATGLYYIDGDLASANISIRTMNEGDYGVGNQGAITRIGDTIVGVGKLGVVLLNGGLDAKTIGQVNAVIKSNTTWDLNKALCCNNYLSNQLIISLPITYAITSGVVEPTKHITFTFDYEKNKWGSVSFYNGSNAAIFCDVSGGMVIYNNTFYGMSRCGIATNGSESAYLPVGSVNFISYRGSGAVYKQKTVADSLCFNDFNVAIRARLRTSFDSLGEASLYKTVHRVRVWRVPSQYVLGLTLSNVEYIPEPMDITIRSYADWFPFTDVTYPGLSKTSFLSSSFATAATDSRVFADLPLRDGRMRSIAVEIENGTINQGFYITGLEIIYSAPNSTESKFGGANPRV